MDREGKSPEEAQLSLSLDPVLYIKIGRDRHNFLRCQLLFCWWRFRETVMSDAYADCVGGSLKLKTAAGGVKK